MSYTKLLPTLLLSIKVQNQLLSLFLVSRNTKNSQEEIEDRPRAATFLSSLADYSNTIPTASSGDPDASKPAPPARMGTLIGVYLPCIQNIFGVILFIRLTWVVGTAGAIQGFLIVLVCCCTVSFICF